ncbi:MAG: hypothetical protein H2174_04240 [Vampirovibrio sp.]|nr:hypothetical protein [Vampirovibrio sp.]
MSISQMNLNVANDAYGVKEAKRKTPANVQPREEATATLNPSTPDTVELSLKKDDASATPPSADGSTPPAKAPFPVVPVAIGGVVGAGAGAAVGHGFFGEEAKDDGKADLDDGKFKPKGDDYKVTGKESVEHKGFTYKVKLDSDNKATIDTITGTIKGDTIDYAYSKSGSDAVLTRKIDAADPLISRLIPTGAAGTTPPVAVDYHVEVKGDVFTLKPAVAANSSHPEYKGTIKDCALTLTTAAEAGKPLLEQNILDDVKATLTNLKLGEAHKEFKAFSPAKLGDMIHMKEAGGLFGKEVGLPLFLGAGLIGAAGAAAGWFFGKKKPEPTPEAPPAS